jgi:hypothetical protein
LYNAVALNQADAGRVKAKEPEDRTPKGPSYWRVTTIPKWMLNRGNVRAADAKEVGVENPAEETSRNPD